MRQPKKNLNVQVDYLKILHKNGKHKLSSSKRGDVKSCAKNKKSELYYMKYMTFNWLSEVVKYMQVQLQY